MRHVREVHGPLSALLAINDVGVRNGHGLYHESGRHVTGEGQHEEKDGAQNNACIAEGLGERQSSDAHNQVENVRHGKLMINDNTPLIPKE